MTGFFSELGAFGAGLAPGLKDYAQSQSTGDLGNALAQMYGGQASPTGQPNSGPLGSIGSLFSNLTGQGAAPQAMPQVQPQPTPQITMPQGARSGAPQGGMQTPPVIAPGGGVTPAQPPPQAPQQAPPQAQAPPQQAQAQPQPMMHAQPQAQQPQLGQGPLDIPQLVQALVKRGVTGRRLGEAVTKAVPLLSVQGLQQYRALGLQLAAERQRSIEEDRAFNRDPNAAGSRAQSRVANQSIAVQRMEGIQGRFKERMAAAAEKLRDAKTDKDAVRAKTDLDRVATDLNNELKSELQIAMAPGTSADEQKAAMAKAAEIRQQLQDATDEAIKARRSGGASGDQVGGAKGGEETTPSSGSADTAYGPNGQKMKYKGEGDRSDPKNWEPVGDGG